jgi:VWFA-related protein
MKKRISSLILLFLLFFQLDNQQLRSKLGQEEKTQEAPKYEVTVTLKLVQISVTDKEGNPVVDLEKPDFAVYDNGKLQKITEFEKHTLLLPANLAEAQKKEIEAAPAFQKMNRKIFLFFDFAYNNAIGIKKSKEAALYFINTQLQPTDEVGVLSYSLFKNLSLHEYLTTDHQRIRDVVEKISLKELSGKAENFEEEYWNEIRGTQSLDASKEAADNINKVLELPDRPSLETFKSREDMHQASDYSQKIKELAKALRYIPGIKNIILFSSGIPSSLIYGVQFAGYGRFSVSFLRQDYQDLLKELASSNSKMFVLNSQELKESLFKEEQMTGRYPLQQLAKETGGKYFGNINNYKRDLEAVQNLTGSFYVLGYYVNEKWDEKYHKIKIKVNRPGCNAYAQKGYFNPKPFSKYSDLEKMLHLVDLALSEDPLFQTPIRFTVLTLPYSSKGKSQLAVVSKIPIGEMKPVLGNNTEIVNIIFDKKENIVGFRREKVDFSKLPEKNIYHSCLVPLPPGDYKCRTIIRELKSGKAAVGSSLVVIPKSHDSGIMLYPPLLLYPEKGATFLNGQLLAYPFDSNRYSPLVGDLPQGTREFQAVVRCTVLGIKQPDITLYPYLISQITEEKVQLTFSLVKQYQEDETRIFVYDFRTDEFHPGKYSLHLFAEEKKTFSKSCEYDIQS